MRHGEYVWVLRWHEHRRAGSGVRLEGLPDDVPVSGRPGRSEGGVPTDQLGSGRGSACGTGRACRRRSSRSSRVKPAQKGLPGSEATPAVERRLERGSMDIWGLMRFRVRSVLVHRPLAKGSDRSGRNSSATRPSKSLQVWTAPPVCRASEPWPSGARRVSNARPLTSPGGTESRACATTRPSRCEATGDLSNQ